MLEQHSDHQFECPVRMENCHLVVPAHEPFRPDIYESLCEVEIAVTCTTAHAENYCPVKTPAHHLLNRAGIEAEVDSPVNVSYPHPVEQLVQYMTLLRIRFRGC